MTDTTQAISPFWQQPATERTLRHAARAHRIARSLLFSGPTGTGKWAAAVWVAQALLCRAAEDGEPCGSCRDCARVQALSHPDLHLLFPVPSKTAEEAGQEFITAKRADPFTVMRFDKRPYITLEKIRELTAELNRTSVEGGAKVVIVESAEQIANEDCQSILLKTIEEPPRDAYFLLTSAAPQKLLPTIHSRCQTIRFVPVDQQQIADRLIREIGIGGSEALMIAQVSGGGWGMALRLAAEERRAWRALAIAFWDGAFRVRAQDMVQEIEQTLRPGKRSAGFEALLLAYDVWAACLLRDCHHMTGQTRDTNVGAPIPDLETAWACWRILHNGRSTLYLNVADRHAISGTFLALRRRLRCP